MSTYGTALVVDVAPEGDVGPVADAFAAEALFTRAGPRPGWTRLTVGLGEIEQLERVSLLLAAVGHARAVLAEQYDEYGALWVVLSTVDGVVHPVHRRYVLNADPDDPDDVALALADLGTDPRVDDVDGPGAALAAAHLFGVHPGPMLEAEVAADTAYRELGVVGGPFPWWDALGLAWPGPDA